ncbi:MAG TPA: hypothetical protein VGQ73_03985 [Gemmatimonadales bacterium]|jgi:hypothetical protein|nr:hypothetical protein [Gemmatimonadales bacterium]
MQREPNDDERDYDSDNEQESENFEAGQLESERPAAETGRPKRATGKSGNKRSGLPAGPARGKRSARRTGQRASR